MRIQRQVTGLGLAVVLTILMGFSLASAVAAQSAQQVAVEIGNNFFRPTPITVRVGDTVTWTHRGTFPHDVTSDTGAFESPRRMANGQTFSFTATAAGTYPYHCTIHSGMDGTLVVQAAATAGPAGTAGMPRTGAGGMATETELPWSLLLGLGLAGVVGLVASRAWRRHID